MRAWCACACAGVARQYRALQRLQHSRQVRVPLEGRRAFVELSPTRIEGHSREVRVARRADTALPAHESPRPPAGAGVCTGHGGGGGGDEDGHGQCARVRQCAPLVCAAAVMEWRELLEFRIFHHAHGDGMARGQPGPSQAYGREVSLVRGRVSSLACSTVPVESGLRQGGQPGRVSSALPRCRILRGQNTPSARHRAASLSTRLARARHPCRDGPCCGPAQRLVPATPASHRYARDWAVEGSRAGGGLRVRTLTVAAVECSRAAVPRAAPR